MDQRTRRSPARFLAPLALIVVVIAFLAIVSGGGGGSGGSSSSGTSSPPTTSGSQTKTSSTTAKKAKKKSNPSGTIKTTGSGSGAGTYTVKVGDTLGGIAAKTGIPLSKIQELNPNVDPHAMVAGQQIKLK